MFGFAKVRIKGIRISEGPLYLNYATMYCCFQLMPVHSEEDLERLEFKDEVYDLMEQSGCDMPLKVVCSPLPVSI